MMINLDMSDHHKDQLLMTLFYHMSQETRRKLMAECPEAYNDACSGEYVRVHVVSDGRPIVEKTYPQVKFSA